MTASEKIILGDDFVIWRNEYGYWELVSNKAKFALVDSSDFRRIISLLEMPIKSVRLELGPDFPYINLIEVGLRHDSDYWISLAISWVAHSSVQEAISLVDDLKKLSVDKAISQSNRHFARKELNRLVNG
jgi:hypothetical protein